MSITLYNPKNGANIGVTDANGIGQLILSDKKAYVHRVEETITYEDAVANELLKLYPFLINVEVGKKKPDYEKIELNGQSFLLDPITRKVIPKKEADKETVKEVIELQEVKKTAIPSLPKEAVKIKVDKIAISRHNTDNVLKNFKDYGTSDYPIKDDGLTSD